MICYLFLLIMRKARARVEDRLTPIWQLTSTCDKVDKVPVEKHLCYIAIPYTVYLLSGLWEMIPHENTEIFKLSTCASMTSFT